MIFYKLLLESNKKKGGGGIHHRSWSACVFQSLEGKSVMNNAPNIASNWSLNSSPPLAPLPIVGSLPPTPGRGPHLPLTGQAPNTFGGVEVSASSYHLKEASTFTSKLSISWAAISTPTCTSRFSFGVRGTFRAMIIPPDWNIFHLITTQSPNIGRRCVTPRCLHLLTKRSWYCWISRKSSGLI